MMPVVVEPMTGAALTAVLPDLARLRITVFVQWPYLYDGTLAYEQAYLAKFAAARDAVIVVARAGAEIVGVSTASPLEGQGDDFVAPFAARGIDPATVCYFGESVLLPAYRGQGIGHAFFDHRLAHAASLGRFTMTAFCAVQRPHDHHLRPADYRPLDAFWRRRGYHPMAGLTVDLTWKDIDQPQDTTKHLQFWSRDT